MKTSTKVIIYVAAFWFAGPIGCIIAAVIINKSNKKKKYSLSDEIIIAADNGHKIANQKIDEAFDKGMTNEEYNELRRNVYLKRAKSGDANAQYWMGFLERCVYKNASEALMWYEKSANQGDARAMYDLSNGYCEYENDPETRTFVAFGYDKEKETYWLTKAANAGHAKAQYYLALNCQIDENYTEALHWAMKAVQNQDKSVWIKSYKLMANIYGNPSDEKHYNEEKEKKYLVRALCVKQENVNDIDAYDDTNYASAAFALGCRFATEYKKSGSLAAQKNAAYCFVLASSMDSGGYAKKWFEELNYSISDSERLQWENHGKHLEFHLPA